MEVQTQFGIDADPKVVVHDEDAGRVFCCASTVSIIGNGYFGFILLFLIGVKNYSPAGNSSKLQGYT